MGSYNEQQTLTTMLKDLQQRTRTLETTPRLPNSSVDTGDLVINNGGSMIVSGGGNVRSDDFDGTGPSVPGTDGWWLGGEGAGAVFNRIYLRDGIVGPGALQFRTGFGAAYGFNPGFGMSTALDDKAISSIDVPDWAVAGLFMVTGGVTAHNTRAVLDYFYVSINIGSYFGAELYTAVPAGSWGMAYSSFSVVLAPFTSGSSRTIDVSTMARTNGGSWSVDATNTAMLSGTAVFFSEIV